METPDIVVVGLGPAGSSAAAAAAGAGLHVMALERKPQAGLPVQCAEFVPALLQSEVRGMAGVTQQPVTRMQTFIERLAPDEVADFPGRMIDRAAFDRMLADQARAAGAVCRYGVGVQAVGADGAICTTDGERVRPKLLIGADGPHSRIGAAIGRINNDIVETRQITVPLVQPHDATDIFLRAEFLGGYGWLFPRAVAANLGLGLAPRARHLLKPLLSALHGELVAHGRIGAAISGLTGGAIPVGGRLPATGMLGRVPVLLAGDAAGLTNPVTGAGISAAVLSGRLAGAAAAEWLGGRSAALDDYDEELGDMFDAAFARALRRRRDLLAAYGDGRQPDAVALRASWIAYPQYWAG